VNDSDAIVNEFVSKSREITDEFFKSHFNPNSIIGYFSCSDSSFKPLPFGGF